jgi:hypothetical protein
VSPDCGEIQERLTDSGPAALRADPSARHHIAECEDCYAFLETLCKVDAAFRTLPLHDAPDVLVERVVAAARRSRWTSPSRSRGIACLGIACLIAAIFWLLVL